ncbi:Lrp/AsnC family transcriptional regulator [Halobellus clavatus]|uniref:Transcriptional regulator, AsnC family n=1 Tax=Halobellus clavatus TaxID=660517 RepID=A0A1H3KFV8_9EURY|nr:Lrp/AsnC ligand binding domain-containing protein [Halobellus clavatus]SDY50695.1 transcriptional regulator, AsnC family [Halobellus clavatus]
MVRAFVMVQTDSGEADRVVEAVRDLAAVREAHVVAGGYDAIVETDADAVYDLLDVSSTQIQALSGVTDTTTYIAMD